MGMFDTFVEIPIHCPKCGLDMSSMDFQTKDLDCVLNTYKFGLAYEDLKKHRYIEAYEICKCGANIDINIHIDDNGIPYEIAKNGVLIYELGLSAQMVKIIQKLSDAERKLEETNDNLSTAKMMLLYHGHKNAPKFCGGELTDHEKRLFEASEASRGGDKGFKSMLGAIHPVRMKFDDYVKDYGKLINELNLKDADNVP